MLECIILFLGVLADQISKLWAAEAFAGGATAFPLIPGILNFHWLEGGNTGAAWGIFSSSTVLLSILSGAAILLLGFLLFKYRKTGGKLLRVSLSMIMAGAMGNLIDRVFQGTVADFLEFGFMQFPIFNVADCLAVVGVALFFLFVLLDARKEQKEKKEKKKKEGLQDANLSG